MGTIRSGEYFYYTDLGRDKTFLVQYRDNEPSGKPSSFWKANTVHRPVLLYKDWYQVRSDGNDLVAAAFDLPFMDIFAVPVPGRVELGVEIELLFISRGLRRKEKIHASVDGAFVAVLEADFTEENAFVFKYAVHEEGHHLFYRETNGRRIALLEFDCERAPSPLMSAERSSALLHSEFSGFAPSLDAFVKSEVAFSIEELYFCLKDVMDPEEYGRFDFSVYDRDNDSKKFGITRLLNTMKFLSKHDELKLVEDLFLNDFESGLFLYEHYFTYDILFYLEPLVLRDICDALPATQLNILVKFEDKFRKEKLLTAMDPIRRRQIDALAGIAVSEAEFKKARQSAVSFSRAYLQREFGAVISTHKRTQSFYRPMPEPSSSVELGAGLRRWSVKQRTVHVDFNDVEKFRSPEICLWNVVGDDAPFCSPVFVSKGKLLLRFLRGFDQVQIVKDEFGLTKEEITDHRDVSAGAMILMDVASRTVRFKIGALSAAGLSEQMLDVILCSSQGADMIMDGRSEDIPVPVRLLKADEKSVGFFCAYTFSRQLFVNGSTIRKIQALESDMLLDHKDVPLTYCFFIDTGRTAASVFFHRNLKSLNEKNWARPEVLPARMVIPVNRYQLGFSGTSALQGSSLVRFLESSYEEYHDRYLRCENIVLVSDLTSLLYLLTVHTAEPHYKEQMDDSLKKLNTLVRSAPFLDIRERLHVFFRLKRLIDDGPVYLKFWIDSMLSILLEAKTEEEDPENLKILLKTVRAVSQLERVEQRDRNSVFKELKDQTLIGKDPAFICRSLALMAERDPGFVKKSFDNLYGYGLDFDGSTRPVDVLDAIGLAEVLDIGVFCEVTKSEKPLDVPAVPDKHVDVETQISGKLMTAVVRLRRWGPAPVVTAVSEGGLVFVGSDMPGNEWAASTEKQDVSIRTFVPKRDRLTLEYYIADTAAKRLLLSYSDGLDEDVGETVEV